MRNAISCTVIYLNPLHLEQIRVHAEKTYPEECCGLLLGTIEESGKWLVEVRETDNNWGSQDTEILLNSRSLTGQSLSKRNRFSISPQVLLQVQKEVRDRHLEIIGIYHSHPDYPPTPSEFDQAIAWSQYSYLIASVQLGEMTDIRSWQLDENHQFQSERIEKIS